MAGNKTMMLSSACMLLMLLVSSVSAFINPPMDPKEGEFLPCFGAFGSVLSCEGFMSGKDEQPSGECCNALQGLDSEAMKSLDDQKNVCQCFENSIADITIHPGKLSELTQTCGTSYLPTEVDFDCNSL